MAKRKETKIVAKHSTYNNSPVIGANAGELFESDAEKRAFVTKAITDMMEYFGVPIVKSDEEFIERTGQYFTRCAQKGIRPTWEEFALAMGTTRATLWDWEAERSHTVSPGLVKQAKEFMAAYDARAVADNKLNPVAYIFRSKNYYGMRDQQEHILTPNSGDVVDTQTLIEQAEMLPDE